jgi:hypothetical protein
LDAEVTKTASCTSDDKPLTGLDRAAFAGDVCGYAAAHNWACFFVWDRVGNSGNKSVD